MAKSGKTSDTGAQEARKVPTNFLVPQGLPGVYVDAFLLQKSEDMLLLSLFQNDPPIILSREDAESVKSVDSYCQGRFVISKQKAKELVEILLKRLSAEEASEEQVK